MQRQIPVVLLFLLLAPPAHAGGFEYRGELLEVVDMHLHPADYGAISASNKSFVVESLPPFAQLYYGAIAGSVLDPWLPAIGMRDQLSHAGIGHGVLLAVYTHRTTGYFTNEELEATLADPRNVTESGRPWAWGMASINFFDGFDDEAVRASRYAALRSYFAQRPDLFIGIKLAHAHQSMAFDDERQLEVYEIAAEFGVPVLLHTGFSPFPGTERSPEYYDPLRLEQVILNHGPETAQPVDFILSHVGQGDARAVVHALELAERHDNVWLELSALARPIQIDEEGNEVNVTEPQLPWVIEEILTRGLVDRAIFASDGPQFTGFVAGYLAQVADAMDRADYTVDQARSVLSGNFYRVFGLE